jgi:hypothetical protein
MKILMFYTEQLVYEFEKQTVYIYNYSDSIK